MPLSQLQLGFPRFWEASGMVLGLQHGPLALFYADEFLPNRLGSAEPSMLPLFLVFSPLSPEMIKTKTGRNEGTCSVKVT